MEETEADRMDGSEEDVQKAHLRLHRLQLQGKTALKFFVLTIFSLLATYLYDSTKFIPQIKIFPV